MVNREGGPGPDGLSGETDGVEDGAATSLDLSHAAAEAAMTQLDVAAAAAAAVENARATELDVSAAAAAALEAVRGTNREVDAKAAAAVEAARPATSEHHTYVTKPPVEASLTPRRPVASGFAPTAFHVEVTNETPAGAVAPLAPAFEELPEGTLLAGRYHLSHMVGHGGMGAVYAAHDDDLDEDIALKILRSDLARDAEFKRRLKAEVRLARRVSHPNVCRVHDFGLDDEIVFVTMELVRGRTLRERIAEIRANREKPLELAQIVDVIVQIGSALSTAHRAGVIHHDVKPDNVILTDGRAVLTDFGVASLAVDSGKRGVVGTPAYLAPEVLRGEASDHRVDIYAVACMAYELIAGETPFGARTLELAMKVASARPAPPPLPEAFGTPALRIALDRVLARGLASDPNLRAPTMERFVDSFAHAARTAPLSPALRGRHASDQITPTDTATPLPIVRRSEQRVTTALVWVANRSAKDTEHAERIVVDHQGAPIRIGPGEIIALFGAIRSGGDDADRAAHAALALVEKFGGHAGLDTTRITLRPGDTSLAGPDSATTAAALAHDAPEGAIWASLSTARQLAARFDLVAVSANARRVNGIAKRPTKPIPKKRTTELGIRELRTMELAELEGHVERACQERRPVFVEVRGGRGAGKTRMRNALINAVRARREVDWLLASISPVGEAAPYSMLASASSDWYESATRDITEPAARMTAARRWLEIRATRRPTVLVVEDMQWADASSRAFVEHLQKTLTGVPVTVILFVRAETATEAPSGVNVVWLGPLDDERATKLAHSLAPSATPEAIARVVARAGGNPFFIEELVRDISATGTSLPPTIEAVIQAHLDQLPEVANQIAVTGSVFGARFPRRAIARLMPGLGDSVLDAALVDLERNGVLAPAPARFEGDDHYQFNEALVRDVAYSRLPARERRQLHAAVAGWLDEQARTTDHDAARMLAIAHHREQAGDEARAASAYRQAGKLCLDQFAFGEAAAALRKAVALMTVPDPTLDEQLGDALVNCEGYPAAEPIFQRAFDETDDEDPTIRARLLFKLGTAATKRGNTKIAIARYESGLALAAPNGKLAAWAESDPRIPAQLWGGLGWTLGYQLGHVDEGHPHCERAVALLENTPHRRDLAQALSRLGGTYMRACRYADQLRCNQRNLAIAVELGDLDMQLTANINLGVVYGVLGDVEDAVAATLRARAIAARTGAASSDGLAASNLAGYYIELGRLDEADAALDEAIETLERTGSRYVLCETFVYRARALAARDEIPAARGWGDKSLQLARSLGNQLDEAVALRILAQIDSRAGYHDPARERIEQALVLATLNDELEAVRTRAARARIMKAAGDAHAEQELTDLEGELTRLGTKRDLAVLRDLREVR
ncbi:MAG TPA: protein kinase [Kofleriaceae bacterium]|nr:protein kinase [Kofleriaceae bacterium]